MFAKALVICVVAYQASAITTGNYYDGSGALGVQSEQTVRGFAGLSSISKQHKTIQTPHSFSQKHDVRATSDSAFPAVYSHGYAAPAVAAYHHATPANYPGYAHPGYAAHPAYHHATPANYHGYAHPAYHHGYAAPAIAKTVVPAAALHYSPAIGHSHSSFSGFGIQYGY